MENEPKKKSIDMDYINPLIKKPRRPSIQSYVPSRLPAVRIATPASSYRPEPDEHQKQLKKIYNEEMKRIASNDKVNELLQRQYIDSETLRITNTEDNIETISERGPAPLKKGRPLFPKEKRRLEKKMKALKAKRQKMKRARINAKYDQIPAMIEQIEQRAANKKERKEKVKEKLEKKKGFPTKKLSKHKLHVEKPFLLESQLPNHFRNLPTAINPLKDHFQNLVQRNIVPAGRRKTESRTKKRSSYMLHRFKEFSL